MDVSAGRLVSEDETLAFEFDDSFIGRRIDQEYDN